MSKLPLPDAVDLIVFAVLLVGFSMPFIGIWIRYLVWKRRWRMWRSAHLNELAQKND